MIWLWIYMYIFFICYDFILYLWAISSFLPSTGLNPLTLPSPDSCLFSPTLSRDLIEGNHSDKKLPTMMLLCLHARTCLYVCEKGGWGSSLLLPPFQPHHLLSSLTLSTTIKMPCRSLDLSTLLSPPNKPFVWHRRGTEAARETGQLLLLTGCLGPLGAPP